MHAAHEADDKDLDLRYSLGFLVDDDQATIGDVIPRSPADFAGAAPGSHILALNGYKWSKELAHDTLAAPPDPSGRLTLLVQKDDMFKTLELQYSGGERYPSLVREAGTPDLLSQIAHPRAAQNQPAAGAPAVKNGAGATTAPARIAQHSLSARVAHSP
jgi:predicted metalloprotease with PDZ domain